jgi:hypothetical protein
MKLTSLTLLLALAMGCGVKAKNGKPIGTSSGESSSVVQELKFCPNDLRMTEVPSGWVEVRARDLVTRKKAHYELVSVRTLLNASINAHTVTVSIAAEFGEGRVTENKVLCQNLLDGEFLKFNVEAPQHISARNGNLHRSDRRQANLVRLSYDLQDGLQALPTETIVGIDASSESALNGETPLKFMESSEYLAKFYKLPDGSLEVRRGEVVQLRSRYIENAEFSTILRYRLVQEE